MTPRLPPGPATDEDSRIWWNRYWKMTQGRVDREHTRLTLQRLTLNQDGRDADLMLTAQYYLGVPSAQYVYQLPTENPCLVRLGNCGPLAVPVI